ncbi:MAG: hypothetical protein PHH84_01515 [Oscillospiraceae bacterium]|nr:hypothetical protein [Oscillospiraceae bacterium]MDD4545673.1 hypothetical protein [Oscillospiraceae bacterium]
MKTKGVKKFLAILLSVAMLVSISAFSAAAESTEYSPNRSITITNVSEANPTLRFTVLPFDLGENGPYHLFAKMKIEGYGLVDGTKDGSVTITKKYGNYDDNGTLKVADKQESVKWTANTDGWVDMTLADGRHIPLDNFDTDLILEFTMSNAKGSFTFADLVIADKDDEIAYSLANDTTLNGVVNLAASYIAGGIWTPSVDKTITAISVFSKGYTYTPNNVLSIDIPHTFPATGEENTPLTNPEANAYNIIDFGNAAFPADKGPYTVRGMFKVENFGVSTFADHQWITDNACFFIEDAGIRPLRGDTGSWIPLVKQDGTPYSFDPANMTNKWVNIMGSWGATGKMSLADMEIYDSEGTLAYSFATDTTLVEGDVPWRSSIGGGAMLSWAYFTGLGSYKYDVNDVPVTHTDADYELLSFDETYVPFVEPITTTTTTKATEAGTTTTKTAPNPATGSGAPIAAALMVFGTLCVSLMTINKKRAH